MFKLFDKELMDSIYNDNWNSNTDYPKVPFNMRKLVDKNGYLIEVQVPGFSGQELEVYLDGSTLLIEGNPKKDTSTNLTYVEKFFAIKPFKLRFAVGSNAEVISAELANGILKIWLDYLAGINSRNSIPIKENKIVSEDPEDRDL